MYISNSCKQLRATACFYKCKDLLIKSSRVLSQISYSFWGCSPERSCRINNLDVREREFTCKCIVQALVHVNSRVTCSVNVMTLMTNKQNKSTLTFNAGTITQPIYVYNVILCCTINPPLRLWCHSCWTFNHLLLGKQDIVFNVAPKNHYWLTNILILWMLPLIYIDTSHLESSLFNHMVLLPQVPLSQLSVT